ncbi:hypothetical protein HDU93_002158, partial [Gonapodya sp. JEL0774]
MFTKERKAIASVNVLLSAAHIVDISSTAPSTQEVLSVAKSELSKIGYPPTKAEGIVRTLTKQTPVKGPRKQTKPARSPKPPPEPASRKQFSDGRSRSGTTPNRDDAQMMEGSQQQQGSDQEHYILQDEIDILSSTSAGVGASLTFQPQAHIPSDSGESHESNNYEQFATPLNDIRGSNYGDESDSGVKGEREWNPPLLSKTIRLGVFETLLKTPWKLAYW